ncbi:hypothetical protein [Hymenobacter guriensis]|uniref:Uncharacterized protein n=1 Tax=Hymenobacter guriensis TaxID=2793065 RepID=A0ABS0L1C7_9BACT|nr:hypothetical protein [Hymenobacter guriensis]MBG8553909.1 hypothetical protein [Hymenobacter guriensis]
MSVIVTIQEQPAKPENQFKLGLLKVVAVILLPIWLPLLPLFLLGLALVFGFQHLWDKLRGTALTPEPLPPSEPVVVWQNGQLAVLMQDTNADETFYESYAPVMDAWDAEVAHEYCFYQKLTIQPALMGLYGGVWTKFVHSWADGVLLQLLEAAPGSEAGVTSWLIYVDGRTLSWRKLREIGLYTLQEVNPPLTNQVQGWRINGDTLTVQLQDENQNRPIL